VLLAWERATVKDRTALENLIQQWQSGNLSAVNALLAKYETFEPSIAAIEKFLELARGALRVLPVSAGVAGLLELTDFLAQQTKTLVVQ